MIPEGILLSTAYFPPLEYFSLIKNAESVVIEKEENYLKQTYRNRCRILSANGIIDLSVPVTKGPDIKTPVKNIGIDYSKRWQDIHIRTLASAYGRSPYFDFYSDMIKELISREYTSLLDLNNEILCRCLEILGIKKILSQTRFFQPDTGSENDFRYRISPKRRSGFKGRSYIQVFGGTVFHPNLSILDLIFNTGPDAPEHI